MLNKPIATCTKCGDPIYDDDLEGYGYSVCRTCKSRRIEVCKDRFYVTPKLVVAIPKDLLYGKHEYDL